MTIDGVDYSYGRPDAQSLHALGMRFACRYLSYNAGGKNLVRAEADALIAAGIAVVSNWENAGDDARAGYDAGRRHGAEALRQAVACGAPEDRPIYFSVDFDIRDGSPATVKPIRQYFQGIHSVLGLARTGVFGGHDTIGWAVREQWAAWFWQTCTWSEGRWQPANNIEQYRAEVPIAGIPCGVNRAMTVDYGQWGLPDAAG